jgi:hypothetical protein
MAKITEDVAEELPLDDERTGTDVEVKKRPRHVVIALNHLEKQRSSAVVRFEAAQREITDLNKAIEALG